MFQIKFRKYSSIYWYLTSFVLVLILAQSSALANGLICAHVPQLKKLYLNNHVANRSFNAEIEKRLIDQYIQSLDASKIYLFNEDVTKIKAELKDIYSKVQKEDCSPIFDVYKIYVDRIKERTQFAIQTLGPKFKFNKDLEIMLDPKQRTYPKTKAEADEFQTKYINFQIANFLASGMKLAEAKKQLVKRYQRNLKNIQNFKQEEMLSSYLDSFARALDPHSSYLSRDVLEDFEIGMRLSLEGIGATLSSQDGYTVIENLIAGGSASKSGLLEPQDKIISVGQGEKGAMESVIDEPLRDVVRKIRGKKGTKVRLSILRQSSGKAERFTVTLTRDRINLEDEAAQLSYLERPMGDKTLKLGVIELPSFYSANKKGGRSCANDVRKLLKEAKAKNVDGIVLDLSNNGGGSLEDSVKVAGLFFKTGNVVETQGANKSLEELADEDASVEWSGPLIVLTSRLSASASEIVAGALQDYKRAVIVGADHTFGKGSVQQVVPLPSDLGALKVTIGMFFVPGGNSTQHRGISADIVLPGLYSIDEIGEKSLDYSLPPRSLAPFLSESAYVKTGPDAWSIIDSATVSKLKTASEKRVSASEDFKKLLGELKKAQEERKKPMKISEVLSDKEKTEKDNKKKKARLTGAEKKKEYLKRADIIEAVNILADLIALQKGVPLKMVSNKDNLANKKN